MTTYGLGSEPRLTGYFRRATEDKQDIMDVLCNGKTVASMVREQIGLGSIVMTGENGAEPQRLGYGYHHDAGENGPELFDQLFLSAGI